MVANSSGGKSSEQWEEQWRHDVDDDRQSQVETNQETALILRDVAATLKDLGARVQRLEETPAALRLNLGTYGGCLGQLVFALFGAVGAVGGIAGVVSVLWTLFHH